MFVSLESGSMADWQGADPLLQPPAASSQTDGAMSVRWFCPQNSRYPKSPGYRFTFKCQFGIFWDLPFWSLSLGHQTNSGGLGSFKFECRALQFCRRTQLWIIHVFFDGPEAWGFLSSRGSDSDLYSGSIWPGIVGWACQENGCLQRNRESFEVRCGCWGRVPCRELGPTLSGICQFHDEYHSDL